MKIIYLTSICLPHEELEILRKSKCGLQNSIIQLQTRYLEGFIDNKYDVEVINYLPIGSYPKNYKDLVIKNNNWKKEIKIAGYSLGFVNIDIVKQLILTIKTYYRLRKICRLYNDKKIIIIMYDLLIPYIIAVRRIKKKFPNIITSSIVADLPGRFGYNKFEYSLKGYLKKYLSNYQMEEISRLDFFCLLTDYMKVPLKIKKNNFVVIEGIVNEDITYTNLVNNHILLYAGALSKSYNIDVLIKAFSLIDDTQYQLWICGSGNYEDDIRRASSIDRRIKYFNYVTIHETYELEQRTTILINPRQNIGNYTKYSFPSKTLEYLASGRPMIGYHLDGMPKEYYKYIISPLDNSIEELKKTIIEVANYSTEKLTKIGLEGRNFVIKNKNHINQSKKYLNAVSNYFNNDSEKF